MKLDEARIAELLKPFLRNDPQKPAALSPAQLKYISTYIDILLLWNARVNLTAVREPEEIVTRHFGESMFAARLLFPDSGEGSPSGPTTKAPHVIDVGSGAGFPGLPIKIWAPEVKLSLIESNQKKATFLRELIRKLGLEKAEAFAVRAEDYSGAKGDVVTLRAVERFDAIMPVVAELVASPGRLAVLVGEAQVEKVRELAAGLQWEPPHSLPMSANRTVIIGSKYQDE